jgi:hypothetical protein
MAWYSYHACKNRSTDPKVEEGSQTDLNGIVIPQAKASFPQERNVGYKCARHTGLYGMEVALTRISCEQYGMERENETSNFFWGILRNLTHIEL